MIDQVHVQSLADRYLAMHPSERGRLTPFIGFLRGSVPDQYCSRKNIIGHVTTSAFLLSPELDSLLLIHHRKLQRYLQPGGHVEADASLVASAVREVTEEVGIPAEALEFLSRNDEPIDIDPHRIPANPAKDQPEHWHFDFRYLFVVKSSWKQGVILQQEEVTASKWVKLNSPELLACLPPFVIEKITLAVRVRLSDLRSG